MSGVRHVTVSETEDGQRLDRWLKKHAPAMPLSLMHKMLRTGQIRVDSKRAKPDTRLAAGQDVRLPPAAEASDGQEGRAKTRLRPGDLEMIRSLVLYDDGDVIALNKPAGIAVQGGTKTERHIDAMLDGLAGPDGVRPRLVHRLDKDTSGVMLLARSVAAAQALGKAFQGRDVRKTYWAITVPAPQQNEGTIRAPLAKGMGGNGRERMVIDEREGKTALTDFVVLERAHKNAAFVAFQPRTGRMHQIRVHAADVLNCPLLGDVKYGGVARMEGVETAPCLHLHARRLVLPHPLRKGKKLDITAPLSGVLRDSWQALGFDPSIAEDPFAE